LKQRFDRIGDFVLIPIVMKRRVATLFLACNDYVPTGPIRLFVNNVISIFRWRGNWVVSESNARTIFFASVQTINEFVCAHAASTARNDAAAGNMPQQQECLS
jgi:hypothetical protein